MIKTKTISVKEYLAFERESVEKHEFIFNTIIPMAGAKREHNLVAMNLARIIATHLLNSIHETYPSDMRVLNESNDSYFYPDISVSDGKPEILEDDILTNPRLVVEVASKSTQVFDKTDKFIAYRSLPSLKEYVLVSTKNPEIEIFRKEEDGNWTVETVFGLENKVNFDSIQLEIPLKDIYQRVF
jgi:Uma2 family endonuclease